MIRYPVTKARLRQLIEGEERGWLARAAARTEEFRRKGKYEESSSIWSDVKPVYTKLQGNCKCAYCERKMGPWTTAEPSRTSNISAPRGT